MPKYKVLVECISTDTIETEADSAERAATVVLVGLGQCDLDGTRYVVLSVQGEIYHAKFLPVTR